MGGLRPSFRHDVYRTESGLPHTVVLAADYTAEHEFGIEGLQSTLGIQTSNQIGLEGRTMKHSLAEWPEYFGYRTGKVTERYLRNESGQVPAGQQPSKANVSYVFVGDLNGMNAAVKSLLPRYKAADALAASWGDRGFVLAAYSDEMRRFAKDLAKSIEKLDFAVWWGKFSKNPFDRGGLVLSIPSRVPHDLKSMLLDRDLDAIALAQSSVSTGIKGRIDEIIKSDCPGVFGRYQHQLAYRSLQADWARNHTVLNGRPCSTAHDVVYFLAPFHKEAHSGWYTVEELDQWINGQGPVLVEPRLESEATAALR